MRRSRTRRWRCASWSATHTGALGGDGLLAAAHVLASMHSICPDNDRSCHTERDPRIVCGCEAAPGGAAMLLDVSTNEVC